MCVRVIKKPKVFEKCNQHHNIRRYTIEYHSKGFQGIHVPAVKLKGKIENHSEDFYDVHVPP